MKIETSKLCGELGDKVVNTLHAQHRDIKFRTHSVLFRNELRRVVDSYFTLYNYFGSYISQTAGIKSLVVYIDQYAPIVRLEFLNQNGERTHISHGIHADEFPVQGWRRIESLLGR